MKLVFGHIQLSFFSFPWTKLFQLGNAYWRNRIGFSRNLVFPNNSHQKKRDKRNLAWFLLTSRTSNPLAHQISSLTFPNNPIQRLKRPWLRNKLHCILTENR